MWLSFEGEIIKVKKSWPHTLAVSYCIFKWPFISDSIRVLMTLKRLQLLTIWTVIMKLVDNNPYRLCHSSIVSCSCIMYNDYLWYFFCNITCPFTRVSARYLSILCSNPECHLLNPMSLYIVFNVLLIFTATTMNEVDNVKIKS